MFKLLDKYSATARLLPALITILPPIAVLAAILPGVVNFWQNVLGNIALAFGCTVLLAEIGRDRGKQREPELFAAWGGKPTTRALSFREGERSAATKRLHARLEGLFPDVSFPSPKEQNENPAGAADVYDNVTARLRSMTRDQDKYPLVFKENISYGFRRNLWGLKPVGLIFSAFAVILCGILIVRPELQPGDKVIAELWGAGTVSVALLITWLLVVKPTWVRVPAAAYAQRLLETVTKLEREENLRS